MLSSLVLTSCSDKAEPPILKEDEFLYEEDMNLEIYTGDVFNRIAPSGDGIYYVTGEYLYFYDYASGQSVLLCNKPNCKHNKETDQMIARNVMPTLKMPEATIRALCLMTALRCFLTKRSTTSD